MSNTITAYFKGRVGVAESVYQNDYGIVMAFDSIDLPAHFDCYFSRLNQEEALPGLGADNRVTIPNSILANPGNVTIHIPLHTGEDDSEVEYVIYFKVIGRARPIDDGTPAQMTAIERALALLSQPITNIEEIVNEALSFTGDTFAEMKQELQDDFDEYTETLEGDLATWKGGVESDIDDVEHDFTVLQNQFDTAVAAVSSDTELTDIRVGDDEVTYTTAGLAVRTQFANVKSEINQMDSILIDTSISLNRYDSSLVTSETVSSNKQIAGDGSLVDNNDVDASPFLEIEPNTEYTAGLVPVYGDAKFPSYDLPTAVVFYDDTKTYISRISQTNAPTTFTTPANAKYYRFNIRKSVGVTVPLVNARFMLVYGDTLPSTFSAYTGDSKTPKYGQPIEYSLSSGILTVTSKYGDGNIVVEFGRRGPNNLPDFRYITADGRQKYNNSTDWFGPFVLEALSNIDGDDINNSTYTGGNHNYNNTGTMDSTATARNLSLSYYADGKSLSDGDSGFCSSLEIAWSNRVQAFNTRKADGTGREVLEERHTLKFDGTEWEAYIEIEALENIFCRQYYGLQCAVTNYPIIHMIGATYRKSFQYTSPHDSGNNAPNIYVAHDSNDRLEMEVDRTLDLGKGTMYGTSGTQGFRTAGSKGYTYFITQKNLDANDIYGARGWYRFMPSY